MRYDENSIGNRSPPKKIYIFSFLATVPTVIHVTWKKIQSDSTLTEEKYCRFWTYKCFNCYLHLAEKDILLFLATLPLWSMRLWKYQYAADPQRISFKFFFFNYCMIIISFTYSFYYLISYQDVWAQQQALRGARQDVHPSGGGAGGASPLHLPGWGGGAANPCRCDPCASFVAASFILFNSIFLSPTL